MFIRSKYGKKYHFFTRFLKVRMNKNVLRKKKVMRAYLKYSKLSLIQMIKSLTWGKSPEIVVARFPCEIDPDTGKSKIAVGKTFSKRKIALADAIVSRFDHSALLVFHDRKNRTKQAEFQKWSAYMEATIMHEMVHWGRIVKGIQASSYEEQESYANAFEKEAYGKVADSPEKLCVSPYESLEWYNPKTKRYERL